MCSDSTLVDCAEGQVCITTPVRSSALVSEDDKTVENSTVTFRYSACSGDAKVDCAKIRDKITEIYNGTEFSKVFAEGKFKIVNNINKMFDDMDFTTPFGKIGDFGKKMEEWGKKINERGAQIEKEMKTVFSGLGSIFGDNWINNFVKRDENAATPADKSGAKDAAKATSTPAAKATPAIKPADEKENGGSTASLKVKSYSLILGDCKESTIKRT